MADSDQTTMTLTGIYSGLRLNVSGSYGLMSKSSAINAQPGYRIATDKTAEGVVYNTISVVGEDTVADPASIIISVDYTQDVGFTEVDLDARYSDIPAGTSLQVDSSQSTYSIPKQSISGSSYIGKQGKGLGPFNASIELKLWIEHPENLTTKSSLSLIMSKIEEGNGGPVKKVLLEKIVLALSN